MHPQAGVGLVDMPKKATHTVQSTTASGQTSWLLLCVAQLTVFVGALILLPALPVQQAYARLAGW